MTRAVREAMTPDPACVTGTTPVAEAAALMTSQDVGSLPVVDGTRLVGMITDRDIVTRVVAEGRDAASTPVGEVATGSPVAVESDEDLGEALRLMAAHQVRRLPVVDGGSLTGILAQADVARQVEATATGAMVEEISEPAPGVSARS